MEITSIIQQRRTELKNQEVELDLLESLVTQVQDLHRQLEERPPINETLEAMSQCEAPILVDASAQCEAPTEAEKFDLLEESLKAAISLQEDGIVSQRTKEQDQSTRQQLEERLIQLMEENAMLKSGGMDLEEERDHLRIAVSQHDNLRVKEYESLKEEYDKLRDRVSHQSSLSNDEVERLQSEHENRMRKVEAQLQTSLVEVERLRESNFALSSQLFGEETTAGEVDPVSQSRDFLAAYTTSSDEASNFGQESLSLLASLTKYAITQEQQFTSEEEKLRARIGELEKQMMTASSSRIAGTNDKYSVKGLETPTRPSLRQDSILNRASPSTPANALNGVSEMFSGFKETFSSQLGILK